MAKTIDVTCACGCGRVKQAREVDVKRGWGRYYDKSCKATHQAQQRQEYRDEYLRKQQTRMEQIRHELED